MGFFSNSYHGVPLEVLEEVKAATYRFFEEPVEEKSEYMKGKSTSNNVRCGTSFVSEMEKALVWKDYLSLLFVSQEEANSLWPVACGWPVLLQLQNFFTASSPKLNMAVILFCYGGDESEKLSTCAGAYASQSCLRQDTHTHTHVANHRSVIATSSTAEVR